MFKIALMDDGAVSISGRFDAAQADKAKAFLDSIAESCTVDMTDLDYISSAGLGILLATYKRLADGGCSMTLKNMNQHINRIFQVSGLDKVFHIE